MGHSALGVVSQQLEIAIRHLPVDRDVRNGCAGSVQEGGTRRYLLADAECLARVQLDLDGDDLGSGSDIVERGDRHGPIDAALQGTSGQVQHRVPDAQHLRLVRERP